MEQPRPRLSEVAALAGVSMATVSKVINGRADVAEVTRQRVLVAVESLGYRSPVDRRDSERPQILAILDGLDSLYSSAVLDGVVKGGMAHHVQIVVSFAVGQQLHENPQTDFRWLAPPHCIGVVNFEHEMQLPRALQRLPVVSIDPDRDIPLEWMTIGGTDWAGTKTVTEHLLGLGHRRIGWIGGTERALSSDRLHGYRAALHSFGVDWDEQLERSGAYSFEFGRDAALELLNLDPRPTAIAAGNDELAVGVISAAQSLGLSVPEQLSVTGYDDTSKAAWVSPQLTTVRQPLTDMGRMAVSMIYNTVQGRAPESRHIQLNNQLIVRESTAPPIGSTP